MYVCHLAGLSVDIYVCHIFLALPCSCRSTCLQYKNTPNGTCQNDLMLTHILRYKRKKVIGMQGNAADVTGRTHLACKGLIKICIKAHRTMIIEHPMPVSGYPSFPPP